jgi:Sec-independent protein secretion pathway components
MDLFSPNHIILILLVVLLLFGGKKIPELMKGLGKGMREFKNAKDNVSQSLTAEPKLNVNADPVETKSV